jgi:hypothetical protein
LIETVHCLDRKPTSILRPAAAMISPLQSDNGAVHGGGRQLAGLSTSTDDNKSGGPSLAGRSSTLFITVHAAVRPATNDDNIVTLKSHIAICGTA